MMEEKSEIIPKKGVDWVSFSFALMSLVVGPMFIIKGIKALETGEIIPQTHKSGPLTGTQSIIIGSLLLIVAIGLLVTEWIKALKRRESRRVR